jgi:hypothetical protein
MNCSKLFMIQTRWVVVVHLARTNCFLSLLIALDLSMCWNYVVHFFLSARPSGNIAKFGGDGIIPGLIRHSIKCTEWMSTRKHTVRKSCDHRRIDLVILGLSSIARSHTSENFCFLWQDLSNGEDGVIVHSYWPFRKRCDPAKSAARLLLFHWSVSGST